MRLKNYLAASMTEAMNQVKEELGPDAIIISAETVDGQFKVVASLEEREGGQPIPGAHACENAAGLSRSSEMR